MHYSVACQLFICGVKLYSRTLSSVNENKTGKCSAS